MYNPGPLTYLLSMTLSLRLPRYVLRCCFIQGCCILKYFFQIAQVCSVLGVRLKNQQDFHRSLAVQN
jgi:hypothetical protein